MHSHTTLYPTCPHHLPTAHLVDDEAVQAAQRHEAGALAEAAAAARLEAQARPALIGEALSVDLHQQLGGRHQDHKGGAHGQGVLPGQAQPQARHLRGRQGGRQGVEVCRGSVLCTAVATDELGRVRRAAASVNKRRSTEA